MTCPRYALKILENATDGTLPSATPALRRDCGEIMRRVSSPTVACLLREFIGSEQR